MLDMKTVSAISMNVFEVLQQRNVKYAYKDQKFRSEKIIVFKEID